MSEFQDGYEALKADDIENLDTARAWVKGHFTHSLEEKYATIEGKLRLLEAILENNWIDPSETAKLQSLGVTLGDASAQKLGMEWVIADDEFGRSPVLKWPGRRLISSPVTLISRRVEDGDAFTVHELFEGLCTRLPALASEMAPDSKAP